MESYKREFIKFLEDAMPAILKQVSKFKSSANFTQKHILKK